MCKYRAINDYFYTFCAIFKKKKNPRPHRRGVLFDSIASLQSDNAATNYAIFRRVNTTDEGFPFSSFSTRINDS